MKHTILAAVIGLLVAQPALAETLPMPVEKLGEVQGVPFYKGYGSAAHREAISARGPSPMHRLSWSLPATAEQIAAAQRARVFGEKSPER